VGFGRGLVDEREVGPLGQASQDQRQLHLGEPEPDAPARTATELSRDAGAVLPGLAAELSRAAEIFNDVNYGELPATADGYRIIAELDDQVHGAAQRRHPW